MNKKGFTLIELLAVIVILAIIALISTPIILGIIDDTKKSAIEESARAYLHAIEQQTIISEMVEDEAPIFDGLYNLPMKEVTVSGTTPTSGWVLIEEGMITNYSFVIGGYVVTMGEEISKGDTAASKPSGVSVAYTLGQLVYFDVASDTTCDENSTSTTCYKWRVIETEDNTRKDKITLQMDHNLVNLSAWSLSTNTTGPVTALETLNIATSEWTRVDNLNYTYDTTLATSNYGTYTCINGNCTLNGTTVTGTSKARMITAEEVTKITNTNSAVAETAISKTWTLASSSSGYYFSRTNYITGTKTAGTGNIDLAWLVENTTESVNSGATVNAYGATNSGYWTLSPFSGYAGSTWFVNYGGDLTHFNVYNNSRYGVRPVITVSKLKIN